MSQKPQIRLWLDDVRPMPPGYTHHVKTLQEALQALFTGHVEHISFDHDLGLPNEETGYSVALWIEGGAKSGRFPRMTWEVHSANPVGAARIKACMEQADKFWTSKEQSR